MEDINSKKDCYGVKLTVATANHKKMPRQSEETQEDIYISKIPDNANDLIVITVVKKLGMYVIMVTEKSPAKYRGVFVNRMQNYCLENLELLLHANFIKMDTQEAKQQREKNQKEAIIQLKMLGYIAMLAEKAKCILPKQYKQIAIQIGEAINLIAAWKKSDDKRYAKRI